MAVECVAKTLHISADQGIEEVEAGAQLAFSSSPFPQSKTLEMGWCCPRPEQGSPIPFNLKVCCTSVLGAS